MKIRIPAYAVGRMDVESYMPYGHFFFKKKALKEYHKIRKQLLKEVEELFDHERQNASETLRDGCMPYSKEPLEEDMKRYFRAKARHGSEMYRRMIKNLKETNPDKLDNYPHDEPFINKIWIEL